MIMRKHPRVGLTTLLEDHASMAVQLLHDVEFLCRQIDQTELISGWSLCVSFALRLSRSLCVSFLPNCAKTMNNGENQHFQS